MIKKLICKPTRVCSECKRELPENALYFYRQGSDTKGIRYVCRECGGGKFQTQAKEGYKICQCCYLELLKSRSYFHKKGYKGSELLFHSKCKKCVKEIREYNKSIK